MTHTEELSPSYSWYPRDWRGSTRVRDMSWKERGFYRECLDWSWAKDGLPNDIDEIRRLTGATKLEFPKLWVVAKRMFDVSEDGRLRNARQEKERTKKETFRRRAADGGDAKVRREAARKQELSTASALAKQTLSSALQSAESSRPSAESRVRSGGGSKRPIYTSDRFVVHEWQLEVLSQVLGAHLDAFDLHTFFDKLTQDSRESGLVIPKDDAWPWLQAQVTAEAGRRGLPMANTAAAPTNKRIAGLMTGGQAFLNRRQG